MRELKFRAWHTEQKRMIEVYGLGKDFLTENTFDGVDPGTNAFCGDDMNFLKIMQYTGLKDKNGKEIYEGDIVKLVGGTTDKLVCGNYGEYHPLGSELIVKKLDSGFTLQLKRHLNEDVPNMVGNVNNYDFWNHARSLEIVGHIYQFDGLLTPH